MRLLDLFSGIGGFALGLESAGFEPVAFCEISAKCRFLLNHHWPDVPVYDDVCSLTADRLRADGVAVDAICGGFPCQDISFAGRGAGLAGERSGLWREYARLVRELRPRVVIVENVAALLGRGLGDVLGDLAALGYDAWWDCIPACAVGAPHRRDRLWLVAYARGLEHEGFGDALRRSIAKGLLEAALAYADADVHAGGLVDGTDCGAAGGGKGLDAGEGQAPHGQRLRPEPGAGGEAMADAARLQPRRPEQRAERQRIGARREQIAMGDAYGPSAHAYATGGGPRRAACQPSWWLSEPDVGRVAHGVPARVDRLHGLGNAVVPQIPELIGKAILEARHA